MPRPGWIRGREQAPPWHDKLPHEFDREDWKLAKEAGYVRATPYDSPPPRALGDQPIVAPLPQVSAGFSWRSKPRRRDANVRSDAVDRLIAKHTRRR